MIGSRWIFNLHSIFLELTSSASSVPASTSPTPYASCSDYVLMLSSHSFSSTCGNIAMQPSSGISQHKTLLAIDKLC